MIESIYRFLEETLHYSHPIHPPVAHMPIGLIGGVFLLGLVALLLGRVMLPGGAAHRIIVLAFLCTLLTILFGYMDWQHFYEGEWMFAIKVKLILSAALMVLLLWGLFVGGKAASPSKGVYLLYTLCFLTVTGLGYFGGRLAYEDMGDTYISTQESKVGKQRFENFCGSCHSPEDENMLRAPQLVTPERFRSFLRSPGAEGVPMPAFAQNELPEQKATSIYRFLKLRQCIVSAMPTPEGS